MASAVQTRVATPRGDTHYPRNKDYRFGDVLSATGVAGSALDVDILTSTDGNIVLTTPASASNSTFNVAAAGTVHGQEILITVAAIGAGGGLPIVAPSVAATMKGPIGTGAYTTVATATFATTAAWLALRNVNGTLVVQGQNGITLA